MMEEGGTTKHALIADDSEQLRDLNRLILEMIGFEVTTVPDGLELVRLHNEMGDTIAIIVADHDMPNMTGADAVKQIRSVDQVIPIIIISATSKTDELDAMVESGANRVMQKPFNVSELQKIVLELTTGNPTGSEQGEQ